MLHLCYFARVRGTLTRGFSGAGVREGDRKREREREDGKQNTRPPLTQQA